MKPEGRKDDLDGRFSSSFFIEFCGIICKKKQSLEREKLYSILTNFHFADVYFCYKKKLFVDQILKIFGVLQFTKTKYI